VARERVSGHGLALPLCVRLERVRHHPHLAVAAQRPAAGLDPRAQARIRIYTLAGDLVQVIDHDGTRGDGQAPWNLISRNGQDIESGVYLFTVEWPGGHQVGRFVIIR